MDEGGGAGIDAPGRLARDQHARRLHDFAADDEFLQIAAGQAARGAIDPGCLDAEAGHDIFGVARAGAQVQEAVARQLLARPGRQDDVFGQRHVRYGGVAQPLFRHATHAGLAPAIRRHAANRPAVEEDGIRPAGQRLADQGRGQERLPVAGHAGNPDDFACPHLQADLLQIGAELLFGRHRQPVQGQSDLAGGPAAGRRRAEGLADHHLGQAAGGLLARRAGCNHPAATQDGGVMAQRPDFLQLVRDVEDRTTFAGQPAQRLEQDGHFLRRQDRGRLVHDDQTRVLQQAAHDLNPLALADGEIADHAVRVQLQAVAARDVDDTAAQVALRQLRRDAERNILGDAQGFEQREMLEDHADAFGPCLRGPVRGKGPTAQRHRAGVGPQDAVDNLHQGGFAGAVFAQQGMDLALADVERDVIVRQDAGKRPGDAVELQKGLRHAVHPTRLRRPLRRVDAEAAPRP